MPIEFPSSPSNNQTFTVLGRTYRFAGNRWRKVRPSLAAVQPSLEIDNDFAAAGTLHVDADTGRVGIGTANPAVELHVDGDVEFTGTLDVTGVITTPTPLSTTNDTTVATTAYVTTAISDLIGGAPAALDTLNELAAALNDDSSYASTITTALAGKLDASAYTAADVLAKIKTVDGASSGLDADTLDGSHASAFAASSHTHSYAATSHTHSYLPTAGGTVTGNVTVNSVIYTNEIADRTGTQLVIGAGESQGKHTGMTGELVYITAEGGLQVRTPDSGHSNYQSGWSERAITIGQGKITLPDAVETKIQLYNGYYIGIESSTMAFTSGRYFRFYENGDSGVKVQIDTSSHGIITCYADTAITDYISIYADTTWSRIHASQQIYINNWIYPDPGVRTYDNGSAGAPVYSFRNDNNSGMYSAGNGDTRISTNGTWRLRITSQVETNGNLQSSGYVNSVGQLRSQGVYDAPTPATNDLIHCATSAYQYRFFRSTSVRASKKDIEPLDDAHADLLLQAQPVWYRSAMPQDDDRLSYYGFIAEDMAELDPRFANWGVSDDCQCTEEQLATYEHTFDHPPECVVVTGIPYERLTAHLTNLVQRQHARIESLESRIATLEAV